MLRGMLSLAANGLQPEFLKNPCQISFLHLPIRNHTDVSRGPKVGSWKQQLLGVIVMLGRFVLAAGLVGLVPFGSAPSLAAVTVKCTGGAQLSQAIATARATARPGATLEFLVSGNCVDSVEPPLGLRIILKGNGAAATGGYGASLTAATIAYPAIHVAGGWMTVNNFYIQSRGGSTAYATARVVQNGYMSITNSKVVANGAKTAVGAYGGALDLGNSIVVGNKEAGATVSNNGTLWIYADNGKTTAISYTGQGGEALGCWSATMGGMTTGSGTITIGPSTSTGIASRACQAQFGINSARGSIKITGTTDAGIRAQAGDTYNLVNVAISHNAKIGVEVTAGVVEFDKSSISKPSTQAVGLSAARGGVIFFNNLYGSSSVSWSGDNSGFYNCRQGGHIYGSPSNPTGSAATTGCLVTTDEFIE